MPVFLREMQHVVGEVEIADDRMPEALGTARTGFDGVRRPDPGEVGAAGSQVWDEKVDVVDVQGCCVTYRNEATASRASNSQSRCSARVVGSVNSIDTLFGGVLDVGDAGSR